MSQKHTVSALLKQYNSKEDNFSTLEISDDKALYKWLLY